MLMHVIGINLHILTCVLLFYLSHHGIWTVTYGAQPIISSMRSIVRRIISVPTGNMSGRWIIKSRHPQTKHRS